MSITNLPPLSLPEPQSTQPPLGYEFIQFLPGIYQTPDCEFLQQFLRGLETLWIPIEEFLTDVSVPFDTRRTPEDFLPWLASWVGILLNENWPESKRRLLIRSAVDLYQWRGTRYGLERFLEIYTGLTPQISEPFIGSLIGPETVIGQDAVIGDIPPHCFVVTVYVPERETANEAIIRGIIDAEKPAHTAYDVRIERRSTPTAATP